MFEYKLPDVGEGVAEGEIVTWHVEVGESVTEDQVLAEVETDKAVVDLPSPVDGTILELHAEEGEIVKVGSVVVTIETESSAAESATGGETDASTGEGATADETDAQADDDTASDETEQAPTSVEDTTTGRVFAPPHVRRLARELGVDITAVEGSGPSGRVTETDVREHAEEETTTAKTAEASADDPTTSDEPTRKPAVTRRSEDSPATAGQADEARDRTLAAPATRHLADELGVDIDRVPTEKTRDGEAFVEPEDVHAYAEKPADAAVATSSDGVSPDQRGTEAPTTGVSRREPYRGVRRTIGQRMSQSAFTAPHATHHDTAVVTDLVETRETLKPRASEAGVSLTYLPFVMKAVATALSSYPPLNAELDEEAEEIVYHDRYDIGVAVATDAGLMVPVVEAVDTKGLIDLASEVSDLVSRARSRELAPEELQGSTFTITNFGAIGGEYATPILNYPETGILGLGAIEQRPVVEGGEVVARYTLPLSLSIDHRVVDGAEAASFCNELKTSLETPTHLLL